MFRFLKKKELDKDKEIFERYKTDFGLLQERRFHKYDESTFGAKIAHRSLSFELWKSNHFAWIPSDFYQYRDFVLETTLSFGPDNGYSAAGVIMRHLNDENFYYFLVSNKGMFRFDIVFNGNPLRIIEWSPSPHIQNERCQLRVIAHGSFFSFFIADEWVAEIEDEKLLSGKIGISAQNFNEEEKALFTYHNFLIDSRPVQVEKAHWRWVRYVPVEPLPRLTYARTLISMGNYTAAVVQLSKALKTDEKNEETLLLLGMCQTNLKLYTEALQTLDALLSCNPDHRDALFEKANTLYLMNDFLSARDILLKALEKYDDASTLWNLLGNCEYSLGNWDRACEAYKNACEKEATMPLFFTNYARMLEKCQRNAEALAAYLTASHLFFNQEAYDDLSLILPHIQELEPKNPDVLGFEAKMLFHENKMSAAKKVLEKLVSTTRDGTIAFLYGLILIYEGKREEALHYLTKATRLDSEQTLYWWRLAENKRILNKDYQEELQRAALLTPENPWVRNLAGLSLLDAGKTEEASIELTHAHSAAPHEAEITINLSEALFRLGRKEAAWKIIERALRTHEDHRLINHQANLFARDKNYARAIELYERALRLDPGNPLYMENCAASCLEAEMITRAEELLVKLSEKHPSPSVYNLLGNLSALRMEYIRADMCYTEALRLDPAATHIKLNYASLLLERSQYARAKEMILELIAAEPENTKILALREKLRKRFEVSFSCSRCNRQWWVSRDIPTQEMGKLYGEPPKEAPAGKCPACGKIFCVACGETHLQDKRFVCADCGEFLKLSDDYLKFLVYEYVQNQIKSDQN